MKLMSDKQLARRLAEEIKESREEFYGMKALLREHGQPVPDGEWSGKPLEFTDEWTPEDQKKYYAVQDALMQNTVLDLTPLPVRVLRIAESLFGREWAIHLDAYLNKSYYPHRPSDMHGTPS